MIEQIKSDLKADEGWVPHAYQDHLGYWTIGYGFLIDSRRGGMPKKIAEMWLHHEVLERMAELSRRWPAFDSQPYQVKRAIVNMAYQMGVSGVLNFKRMIAALEAGDWATAATEALDSRWARQTPNRANRVAAWIRGD